MISLGIFITINRSQLAYFCLSALKSLLIGVDTICWWIFPSVPSHSTALHLIGELYISRVNIKLPLPLSKYSGQHCTCVDAHAHVYRRVGRLLHVSKRNSNSMSKYSRSKVLSSLYGVLVGWLVCPYKIPVFTKLIRIKREMKVSQLSIYRLLLIRLYSRFNRVLN